MKKIFLSMLLLFASIHATQGKTNEIQPVLEYIETNQVLFVDFIFLDVLGTLRKITLPKEFVASALKTGLSFDGSSIPGYSTLYNSDMVLMPDLSTMVDVPWAQGDVKTVSIICDIYEDESTPYKGDPRYILKKMSEEARSLGFEFRVGVELEYFLFKAENGQLVPLEDEKYFQASFNLQREQYNNRILSQLAKHGVMMEKRHHEVAPGQYEMSLQYTDAVSVADQLIRAQYAIKALSDSVGLRATFMPKPKTGINGSGMHVNFSLYNREQKKNAFYDPNDPQNFSTPMKQFIAGVLTHAKELSALFNSTINSYKRLIPGFEAPRSICWGKQNRGALVRTPLTRGQKSATRGEMRSPDPLCNPYLAFAGLLKMGLTGIKHGYVLPNAVEEKAAHASDEELKALGIDVLPLTLDQAVSELENSKLAQELLGDTLFTKWTTLKRDECAAFSRAVDKTDGVEVTNWEWQRYF